MKRRTIAIATAALLAVLVSAPRIAQAEDDLAPKLRAALLKVHVTNQSWDLRAPWNKRNPGMGAAQGVVVRPGLILTPASWLTDHIMIEVSEANSARRYPAKLEHVDYSCNLALVKIEDPDLLARVKPLPIGDPLTIDDEFEVWQLGASSDLLERTTGRVQKVESRGVQLELTIKTTLSDRGNGQLVLREGHVVGLVTRTWASRQEGTVLALETIRHYLEDFDSGDYRGFGAGGLFTVSLLRDDLRSWYGVPDDVHGVGVSRVVPGRTGDGVVKNGDVITALAGHELDDEGMFVHPVHGRLRFHHLLLGETHPGDGIAARIYRDGAAAEVKIPVRSWPGEERLVPGPVRDARPTYIVVGGLLIQELNRGSRGVSMRLQQFQMRSEWDEQTDRKRIVYAVRVLDDPANKGLDDIGNVAIATVNGKKITRIQDVAAALRDPQGGFHVISFEGPERDFVVKADELEKVNERIAKRYRIPEMAYLGE